LIIIHTTSASQDHASESFSTAQQSSTAHSDTLGDRFMAVTAAYQSGVIVSCSTEMSDSANPVIECDPSCSAGPRQNNGVREEGYDRQSVQRG
jgi:hypothetical protein